MNKKALYTLSYGVYIISSKNRERFNGQIANVAVQITADPPQIAVALNKGNLTHDFVMESRVFSVSVLGESAPMTLIGKFGFKSGRDIDKFKDTDHFVGETGAPVVKENAVAWLECQVVASVDAGTHTLFIGRVKDGDVISDETPMTYAFYHQVKKGFSPPSAPTYQGDTKSPEKPGKKESKTVKKYKCSVCGYIYDPEVGDPDSGIAPGTAFEDIPDDWVCPVCGVSKDMFEPLEE